MPPRSRERRTGAADDDLELRVRHGPPIPPSVVILFMGAALLAGDQEVVRMSTAAKPAQLGWKKPGLVHARSG